MISIKRQPPRPPPGLTNRRNHKPPELPELDNSYLKDFISQMLDDKDDKEEDM